MSGLERKQLLPTTVPKALYAVSFAVLTIAGCAGLFGQTGGGNPAPAPDDQAKAPALKVTTRLVIVDVVARDKKGNVVGDLAASDVRVLEDGKEQPISSFVFEHPRQPVEHAALPQPVLPANVFSNTRKFPPESALNVILLDSLNSNLLNQAYVRIEMVKFLERLPQGQPVAIYTLGRKLRLIQDFTTDLTELKSAIRTFKGQSSHLSQNPTGTSEVPMTPQGIAEQTLAEKAPQMLANMQSFAVQTTADQDEMRIQYTLTALTSLGRTLSRYKGRKNLIWVSESIPLNIFSDVKTMVRLSPGANSPAHAADYKPNRSYGEPLAHLADVLTDAQVAVYPIDARGLIGSPLYNAASNIAGQGGSGLGGMAMQTEGRQAEELFQSHSAMLDIADRTGGKAFYNRNDIDNALSNGIDDGSTYYMVGYYPQNSTWDGKFRKIEVKTHRPGVKLRYRTGYFAVDRAEYIANHPEEKELDFSQLLDLESPVTSALQFQAEVNLPTAESTSVLLRFAIDPRAIQFTLGPDGLQHARVDCAVRAFTRGDPDKPAGTAANEIKAGLKPEAFTRIRSSFFPCEVKINLPAGQYRLRLAVRDNNTSIVGSANARVTVPVPPATSTPKAASPP